MTLLFVDGFDHYSSSQTGSMWSAVSNTSVTSTNARNGVGQCLQLNDGNHNVQFVPSSAQTNWVMGGGFYFSSVGSSNGTYIMRVYNDSTSTHTGLVLGTDGSILWYRGDGTLLGQTSPNLIRNNAYYYIEWKGVISDSISSGDCVLNVGGTTVLTLSGGSDTKNGSTTNFNRIYYSSNGGLTYLDDVYIANKSGTVNNDFIGDVKVMTIFPNGNGDSSDWTNSNSTSVNNYTYVDDPTPNNNTDYVKAGNVNLVDLYTFQTISNGGASIFGIQQTVWAGKDAAGTRNMKNVVKTGGTVYEPSSSISLADNYLYWYQIFEQNPNTSAAWTETDINGAQYGIKTVT